LQKAPYGRFFVGLTSPEAVRLQQLVNELMVTDNTQRFKRVPGLVLENWVRQAADH